MNVILLTVFIGLILVSFFVTFFLHLRKDSLESGSSRDSLMPLEEEGMRPAGKGRENVK
jgi:hypothetical protein